MLNTYRYERIDRNKITEEQFKQVLKVERSDGEDDCYSEEVMRELFIQDPKIDNFVCYDNDNIIAYISLNPYSKRRNGSAYIISLVVDISFRRQGIAANLINYAARYYIQKGKPTLMSLQVDKDNYPAINLYKKVGFEIKDPICELDIDDEQHIMDVETKKLVKVKTI